MLSSMFMFEWRYFTRQPSFFITAILFFSIAFLAPSAGMSAAGNVMKNGPYLATFLMLFLGMFSLFLVVNFIADTALRDHSHLTSEIIYSKPINPLAYQLGRFFGSFAVIAAIFALVPVGLLVGSLMPWVDASRMADANPMVYLVSYVYFSLPTLFVFSCLFYTLAVKTRSLTGVYLAAVALIIFNEVSESLFAVAELRTMAAIIDPFAFKTFDEITRYWTVFDKNNGVFPLDILLIMNRLLWLSIAVAVLTIIARLNKPLQMSYVGGTKGEKADDEVPQTAFSEQAMFLKGDNDRSVQALWLRIKFEFKFVIFDPAFYLLCGSTLILLLLVLAEPRGMFGNDYWPVTQHMIDMGRNALSLLGFVVITYYSGEIVWREKNCQIDEIINSLPLSHFNLWLSKLLALFAVILALITVTTVFLISYQISQGYQQIEIGQYLLSMYYFTALPLLMMACLSFFCQIIAPNKYAGMAIFVLFILLDFALPLLGVEHSMLRFSHSPDWQYSDMNGYGNSVVKHSVFMLYWAALTLCLVIVSFGLWRREPASKFIKVLAYLRHSLPLSGRYVLGVSLVVFITSGAAIYYHTNIINSYYAKDELLAMHAEYEHRYQQYKDMPIPTMTSLKANVAIYPHSQQLEIDSQLVLSNNSAVPIQRFLVSIPGYNSILDQEKGYSPVDFELHIAGGGLLTRDGPLNTHWFEFDTPLLPGEQRTAVFRTKRSHQGISHNQSGLRILQNGSFFQNSEVFPRYGYIAAEQLLAPEQRKKFDLPALPRAHDLNDSSQYQNSILETVLGINGGELEFEATVSTASGQTAIAPGYLTRHWSENGREYFHYKMDKPIANYFAFFSGYYETIKAQHTGVELSVYFHPGHGMNVQRIMQSMKDSLDYYSSQFGPYQHKQMRVVEFAGPDNFGQAFPNVIAYSEASGFIHDQRQPGQNDQLYWFIAHEMAHQWWGGQVDAANVQGGTVLVETLAQYSAYALMQSTFGKQKVADMLEYELDRYLRGRSRETIEELPLMREENQAYLHYNKGAIVMMSLLDLLGEKSLNNALKNFLNDASSNKGNYPTTLDLLQHIKRHASPIESIKIDELFGQIILYDLAVTDAKVSKGDKEQYQITVNIVAHKINADVHGQDQRLAMNEVIDIALFKQDDEQMPKQRVYLGAHQIKSGDNRIIITTNELPSSIRIDPFIRFIDRDIRDNSKVIAIE